MWKRGNEGGGGGAYFIAQPLRGNNGDFIAGTLVDFEVEGEAGVVALDEDFGGFLDGLRIAACQRRRLQRAGEMVGCTFVLTRPMIAVVAWIEVGCAVDVVDQVGTGFCGRAEARSALEL